MAQLYARRSDAGPGLENGESTALAESSPPALAGVPPSPTRVTTVEKPYSPCHNTSTSIVVATDEVVAPDAEQNSDAGLTSELQTEQLHDGAVQSPTASTQSFISRKRRHANSVASEGSEDYASTVSESSTKPAKRSRSDRKSQSGADLLIRRTNILWNPERHAKFLVALRACQARTPDMVITATMIHKELTRPEYEMADITGQQVQSHLQRFRNGSFRDDDQAVTDQVVASLAKLDQLKLDHISNCKICDAAQDDDLLLLCDYCDNGFHTYCLEPPLAQIPQGDWYCSTCIEKTPEEKAAKASRRFYGVTILPVSAKAAEPRAKKRIRIRKPKQTQTQHPSADLMAQSDGVDRATHQCSDECVVIDGHIFHCSSQEGAYGASAGILRIEPANFEDSSVIGEASTLVPPERSFRVVPTPMRSIWSIGTADFEQLLSPHARYCNVRDAILRLLSRQGRSALSGTNREDFLAFLRQLIAREQYSNLQLSGSASMSSEYALPARSRIRIPPTLFETLIAELTAVKSRGQIVVQDASSWVASRSNPKENFVFPTYSSESAISQDVAAAGFCAPVFLSTRDRAAVTPRLGEFWLKWLAATEVCSDKGLTPSTPATFVFPLVSRRIDDTRPVIKLNDPISMAFFAQALRVTACATRAAGESSEIAIWKQAFGNAKHLVFPVDSIEGYLSCIVVLKSASGCELRIISPTDDNDIEAAGCVMAFLRQETLSRTVFAHAQALLNFPEDAARQISFDITIARQQVERGRNEVESNLNVLSAAEALLFGTDATDVRRRIGVAVDAVAANIPTCLDSLNSVVKGWEKAIDEMEAFRYFILTHHVDMPEELVPVVSALARRVFAPNWAESLEFVESDQVFPLESNAALDGYLTDDSDEDDIIPTDRISVHAVATVEEHRRSFGAKDRQPTLSVARAATSEDSKRTGIKLQSKAKWTDQEDSALIALVAESPDIGSVSDGIAKWKEIADKLRAQIPGSTKDSSQCSQHWARVLDPSLLRGPWYLAEEVFLMRLIALYTDGQREWRRVARTLGSRSDQQCRSHALRLEKAAKPEQWSPEADQRLRDAVLHEQATLKQSNSLVNWNAIAQSVQSVPGFSCWLRLKAIDPVLADSFGISIDKAYPEGEEPAYIERERSSKLEADPSASKTAVSN